MTPQVFPEAKRIYPSSPQSSPQEFLRIQVPESSYPTIKA